MSEVSSKRVTFAAKSHNEKNQRKTPIMQRKTVRQTVTTSRSRSSSATRSDGDTVPKAESKVSRSQSSSGSSKSKSSRVHHKVKKSLVRNCDRPLQNVNITRPSSLNLNDGQLLSTNFRRTLPSSSLDKAPQTIPMMNSNLDTARRIKAISEMTLETASSKNRDFEICEEEIIQRVAKIAINVPSTERVFNNLVSVDVTESQLRHRKLNNQVKPREKVDPVPILEDYTRERTSSAKIWPKFPPISISFQPIDNYNSKSVLMSKQSLRTRSEKLFNFE